jgi:hypothetical protein
MLPGVLGTVSSAATGKYVVTLTVGELDLDLLSVDGHKPPGSGPYHLVAGGTPIAWGTQSQHDATTALDM